MILNSTYKSHLLAYLIAVTCVLVSCKKSDPLGKDPYGDAKPALDLKINTNSSNPGEGELGSTVTISGTGFSKYKSDLSVLFNGEKGEVIGVTDTEIKAKVPEWASTGIVTFKVASQILPGPKFRVNGSVKVDKEFASYVGANDNIRSVTGLPDGRLIIVGDFSDYNNVGTRAGYSRIAIISSTGVLDKTFKPGKGVTSGHLNSATLLQDGKILIGGQFSTYNNKRNKLGSIAKISLTGLLDSTIYTYKSITGELKKDTVPTFKAFFGGNISKMAVQPDGNIIVAGQFKYYMNKTYYPNQKDTIVIDSTVVNNLARIKPDGSLDRTYNFNIATNLAHEGFNGYVTDMTMQADGKMLIVGNFSRYNGENANKIVRINTDGTLDKTFNIGSGPSGQIFSIRPYLNDKWLIAGDFLNFNGKSIPKAAILNSNGSVDETFNLGIGADGSINKAQQLGNGKILLAGNFQKFNGITRYGFVIVEPNGKMSPGFNTLGGFIFSNNTFRNPVNDIINLDNESSVIVGSFNSLDLLQNTKLVKITY